MERRLEQLEHRLGADQGDRKTRQKLIKAYRSLNRHDDANALVLADVCAERLLTHPQRWRGKGSVRAFIISPDDFTAQWLLPYDIHTEFSRDEHSSVTVSLHTNLALNRAGQQALNTLRYCARFLDHFFGPSTFTRGREDLRPCTRALDILAGPSQDPVPVDVAEYRWRPASPDAEKLWTMTTGYLHKNLIEQKD